MSDWWKFKAMKIHSVGDAVGKQLSCAVNGRENKCSTSGEEYGNT